MQQTLPILAMYLIGILFLLADLFLPSHGILTVVSLGLLGYALVLTFQVSEQAGTIALIVLVVAVPTFIIWAVKIWHRTPIGRRISPPNPVLTEQDRLPLAELERLIGTTGRSVTLLRPVGMCLFDGRRIECVAECGMITANVEVEGLRLTDRTLVVRPTGNPARAS